MDGHLLTPACPVTGHSHLNSHLHSPVLSAANHHQSTVIHTPASQTLFVRLFFVVHASLTNTSLQADYLLPSLPASDQLISSDPQ